MHAYSRLVMAALAATIALSLSAGAASALRSLSIEGESTFTLNGIITLEGSIEVICAMTFVKTLSRAIPKLTGILMGRVTSIRTGFAEGSCRSSTGTLRRIVILGLETEFHWRLFYDHFAGRLPAINGISFIIVDAQLSFEVSVLGISVTCLFEEEEEHRGLLVEEVVNPSTGVIGNLINLLSILRRSSGSGLCPLSVEVRGTLVPLQSARLRLL